MIIFIIYAETEREKNGKPSTSSNHEGLIIIIKMVFITKWITYIYEEKQQQQQFFYEHCVWS